ncbi:MAG: glycosyl hydrolase [Candidatus Azobacteroides sp.]|nr:glycosyl hydrolase [Candidatus Azobacteroides sp.]
MRNIYIGILFFFICATFSAFSQKKSDKRGIGYGFPTIEDAQALAKGLSWSYNWATLPAAFMSDIKEEMEFIPMAWNGNFNPESIRECKRRYPNCQYILAFNEPNLDDQARMTPSEAAEEWPALKAVAEELGLKIISPAMNYGTLNGYHDPIKWLDEFFELIPLDDVDGIAVHCYMASVSSLKSFISSFEKYNKPIWLTEFCSWENHTTLSQQMEYLADAVNYLETDPNIYKYAWFTGRSGASGSYPYMQLLGRRAGELTDLGEIYVNMSSFDKDFYYTTEEYIEAENYIDVSDGVHLEKTTDTTGTLNLTDFLETRWTVYNIDIPASGEYYLLSRVANRFDAQLQFSIDDQVLAYQDVAVTGGLDQWETLAVPVYLEQGKQQLRVDVSKGRVNLNWLKISKEATSIPSSVINSFRIYPNPTTDRIFIDGPESLVYSFSDLTGNVLKKGNSKDINLIHYPAGIYLLNVQFPDGTIKTEKVIKK